MACESDHAPILIRLEMLMNRRIRTFKKENSEPGR